METQLIEQLKIACTWLHFVDGQHEETRAQIAVWRKLIKQAEKQPIEN